MIRLLFRYLSLRSLMRAAKKGPCALACKEARQHAYRGVRRVF